MPRNGRYPSTGKPRGPGGSGASVVWFLELVNVRRYQKGGSMRIERVRMARANSFLLLLLLLSWLNHGVHCWRTMVERLFKRSESMVRRECFSGQGCRKNNLKKIVNEMRCQLEETIADLYKIKNKKLVAIYSTTIIL